MKYFKIVVPKEMRDMVLIRAKNKKEAWAIMQRAKPEQICAEMGGGGWSFNHSIFSYVETPKEESPVEVSIGTVCRVVEQSNGGKDMVKGD